jgi:cytidine deaminase
VTATLDGGQVRTLLDAARAAAAGAYAPYSRFPVGAAVLTDDGAVIAGSNVENASYGLTVCAERVAVWTAVAAGARTVRAMAVVALKGAGATPCGACRQVLREFVPNDADLIVVVEGGEGSIQIPLSSLLPLSFGPENLRHT